MNLWPFKRRAPIALPKSVGKNRAQLMTEFIDRPEHQWVVEDNSVLRSFKWLWESLPQEAIAQLADMSSILFVKSSGRLSGTYTQNLGIHVVLVFPDLLKMLKAADPSWGVVTLIHELGHILEGHSQAEIAPLEAQVQADAWVVKAGLGPELETFLLSLPENTEKRVRLTHLSALWAQNQ